jgi:hypothetical protein
VDLYYIIYDVHIYDIMCIYMICYIIYSIVWNIGAPAPSAGAPQAAPLANCNHDHRIIIDQPSYSLSRPGPGFLPWLVSLTRHGAGRMMIASCIG